MSSVSILATPSQPAAPRPPRLLDQLHASAIARFGRPEPAERYVERVRRFILFHGKRHPRDLGIDAIGAFLQHVAQSTEDPLGAIEQARAAREFLYHALLHINVGALPFPEPPRLIDRLRRAMRVGHYAPRTEQCDVDWAVRFIRFHGMRHPNPMGAAEIEMFLYQQVLGIELPRLDAVGAKRRRQQAGRCSTAGVVQPSFSGMPRAD